tara:strand:- start:410 stop:745 length:336 start_codon:yes stop_codon:yes gene_type:complete
MANEENLKPFGKGNNANPNGRPKGSKNRSTIVKELLEFASSQKNVLTGEQETLTQEQAITLAMLLKAGKGDVNAYKALMDSCYGAPKQTTDTNLNVSDFDVKDLFKIDSLK